jgi:hypothetical protein
MLDNKTPGHDAIGHHCSECCFGCLYCEEMSIAFAKKFDAEMMAIVKEADANSSPSSL